MGKREWRKQRNPKAAGRSTLRKQVSGGHTVACELLKQYKDKFLMNTYLSQSNPVTTRIWRKRERERELQAKEADLKRREETNGVTSVKVFGESSFAMVTILNIDLGLIF
nr:hypothetical protein [Tanacetum cinerariifolium]